MLSPRPLALCAAALFAALAPLSFAQNVTTTPVGAVVLSFPSTTQVTTAYISLPLSNPSVFKASASSVGSNTITFTGSLFTAGQLAQAGSPYFARIASGLQTGRTMLITANTSDTITVDTTDNSSQVTPLNDIAWALTAGDRIEIIVGDTLASIFGDNTVSKPLVFQGGGVLGSDKVGLFNKTNTKYDAYYFNTSLGRWTSTLNSAVNANNLVLYPESVIQIVRGSGRASTSLTLIGDVPAIAPLVKTVGSNTTVHTAYRFPVNTTLGSLNLSVWATGNTLLAQSDRLGIYDPTNGKFDSYYQRTDGTWRLSLDANTDRSTVVIPAGSIVTLNKKASVSGQTSFITMGLPYTL